MKKIYIFLFNIVLVFQIFSQTSYFKSPEAYNTTVAGARTSDAGRAEQDFRRGVQSFYRGSFNDSIMEFEKALSYLPNENLILDWLGKAYYKSGIEGVALQQWNFASAQGYGGLLLQNRIEIVKARRITDNNYSDDIKYTEGGSFPGVREGNLIFSQPISILPNTDGSFWVLSYGTNELLRIDVNGFVVNRSNGPLNGFDRPMDILRLADGNLLIVESAGDRLTVVNNLGLFVKSFGKKGRGIGELIGPQYAAVSGEGNIFVTDFGNSRVAVFDKDGNGLFNFGNKTSDFEGLKGPTGIACLNGIVFVADAVTGAVYKFDESGNYLGILCRKKTFVRPESMKVHGDSIILCDKNRILSVDTKTGSTFLNTKTGNAPSRVTCAVPDINGNLLVSDFRTNEVYLMSKMNEIVGGLFVQIDRVVSDNFPNITLEVKVENRNRQGIVGLKDVNFLVTENKRPCANVRFEGAASFNDVADITILVDRNVSLKNNKESLETAVREIVKAMDGKGRVRLVCAGAVPGTEYEGTTEGLKNFSENALKTPYASQIPLDLAIRLCANGLVNAEKKRAVIFVSNGQVTADAFTKYGLSDLSSYLNNNSIAFVNVLLENNALCPELSYLQENTNGSSYFVYRSEGLSSIIKDIIDIPTGMYRMSYTSSLQTDFGRAYLPVEVEAYLMNRSGRDEIGYFAPLQ